MTNTVTLRQTLQRYYKEDLRLFAMLLPERVESDTKEAYIQAIEAHLMGPGLRSVVEALGAHEAAAVAYLCHERWASFSAVRFAAAQGVEHAEPLRYYAAQGGLAPVSLLVHDGRVPCDLRPRLRELLPQPAPAVLAHDPSFSLERTIAYSSPQGALRVSFECPVLETSHAPEEVANALRVVGNHKLKWTARTNLLTKASAQLFEQHALLEPDYLHSPLHWPDVPPAVSEVTAWESAQWPRARALADIFWHTGYAAPSGGLSPHARDMLKLPAHHANRDMWRRWVHLPNVDELNLIPRIKAGGRPTSVVGRREGIAQALAQCPVNQWVHWGDFVDYCLASDTFPSVLRPDTEGYRLDARALHPSEEADDLLLGLAYTACFLGRYASGLGVVELALCPPTMRGPLFGARDPYSNTPLTLFDGIHALRLTPLGAWILGLSEAYEPPPRQVFSAFKLLPNGDVVCLESPDRRTMYLLDRFAHRTTDALWHMDTQSLLEAMNRGEDAQELLDFFEAAQQPLPGTVRLMIQQMSARAEALRVLPEHRVVHIKDAILLQEIAHHSRAGKLCTVVGPHHLIVPAHHIRKFQKALRAMGHPLPGLE